MNTSSDTQQTPHSIPGIPLATRLDHDGDTAGRYRAILQRKIDEGARRAAGVITAIQQDQPRDQILPMRAAGFHVAPTGGICIQVGAEHYEPTDFALGQIAGRAGIPLPYLRDLTAPQANGWQHELATQILSQHYSHANDGRVLVRSVRGQLRGWLSNRYRRLDSRPLVEALADEAQKAGAIPIDGIVTPTRVAIKLVLPEILEPIAGEFLVSGGEWSNSDYGNGVHSFRMFVLRVACLNGMTAENVLKQIHLGARLSDNIEFSERTHRLDTAASVSALRDVVRGALGPTSRDELMTTIRDAHQREMTKTQVSQTTRSLPKPVQKSVVDAFESSDVINLPEGPTAWRASNAISWIARHTQDDELRLDLERLAGTVI
ncbi:MAG: hypothetical protein M3O36_18800 [Myxococcota bacterium]|nr:hypothetical protein [Myxococcota bacterium]